MKFLHLFNKSSSAHDGFAQKVRRALESDENYNLLFIGRPASAKTLFLLGILDMRKDGVYFDGSNTRILDPLKEERPQMLIYKQQNHTKVTLGERDEFECI